MLAEHRCSVPSEAWSVTAITQPRRRQHPASFERIAASDFATAKDTGAHGRFFKGDDASCTACGRRWDEHQHIPGHDAEFPVPPDFEVKRRKKSTPDTLRKVVKGYYGKAAVDVVSWTCLWEPVQVYPTMLPAPFTAKFGLAAVLAGARIVDSMNLLPMNAVMRRFFDELELGFEYDKDNSSRFWLYKAVFFTKAAERQWRQQTKLRNCVNALHTHGDDYIEAKVLPKVMTWHLDQCWLKQAGLPHVTLRDGAK